jgi:small redox-active disulfide protein 2
MDVKILGTGCPNCQRLEKLAREAAAEAGIDATFEKVTDIAAILGYGMMSTPGLVVDGQVRSSGRIPSRSEVNGWLREAASVKGSR